MRAVLRGAGGGCAGPLRSPHLLPLLGADAGAVRSAVLRRVPGGAGPGEASAWRGAAFLAVRGNERRAGVAASGSAVRVLTRRCPAVPHCCRVLAAPRAAQRVATRRGWGQGWDVGLWGWGNFAQGYGCKSVQRCGEGGMLQEEKSCCVGGEIAERWR